MADRSSHPHQIQVHPQHTQDTTGIKSLLPKNGPSTTQVLAVVTLLPVGGTLLFLAGITLVGTLIGLAVATPLFIIFSPVLVPAALTLGLAVTGFLSSGAFGLTGLSSLSWVLSHFRQASGAVPDQIEQAKKRAQDVAAYAGQKTKEAGHTIQSKAAHAQDTTGKEGGRDTTRT